MKHETEMDCVKAIAEVAERVMFDDILAVARGAAAETVVAPNLVAAVDRASTAILHLEAARDKIAQHIEDLRSTLAQVMYETGLTSVRTIHGHTVFVREPQPRLLITDEKAIPPSLMEQPPPRPDRDAIMRLLREGKTVPGACLSNGAPTLAIRTRKS